MVDTKEISCLQHGTFGQDRLQEVEEVGYPWHHEHGLVGMEGSHDLVHCILGSQNWQQESEPGFDSIKHARVDVIGAHTRGVDTTVLH